MRTQHLLLGQVTLAALLGSVAGCDRHETPVAPLHQDAVAADSTGGRILFTSGRDGNSEIYVTTPDGTNVTRLTNDPAVDQDPAWSPDGTRIAFASDRDGNYEIYVMNADGSGVTRLTNDPNRDRAPAWCGTRIAFQSDRYLAPFYDVYVMNDDGTGQTRLTISNASSDEYPSWSPACDRIAYSYDPDGMQASIWMTNADGSGIGSMVTGPGKNRYPAWSPDGTRIAFSSDRDNPGNLEEDIYVMNADGSQITRLTQRTDSHVFRLPAWSSDGARIAFQASSIASPGTYTMNPDGSGLAQVADGGYSNRPAWFGPAGPPPPPNELPVPSFTTSCDGFACTFTNTSSDPDGTIVGYSWTFGDFSQASATRDASHTYTRDGTYNVTLVVTDNHGATNTANQIVTVVNSGPNQPPVASFKAICSNLRCTFSSTSTDPDSWITGYRWTFGDGTTSTEASLEHSYAAPGNYTVTLTVTDDKGASDSTAQIVTVSQPNQPPVASFTSNCTGLACSFTSTSSDADGSIVSYSWAFGDGGTSSVVNPSHTYATGGSYTVTLTVTDNQGATNTASQTVTVTPPPPPPPPPEIHIGDLAGSAVSAVTWRADVDITVHDANHDPAHDSTSAIVVTGRWSTGATGACTVGTSGTCMVSLQLPKSTSSVTFTVTDVTANGRVYAAGANHDVDGSSDGTTITVTRRP